MSHSVIFIRVPTGTPWALQQLTIWAKVSSYYFVCLVITLSFVHIPKYQLRISGRFIYLNINWEYLAGFPCSKSNFSFLYFSIATLPKVQSPNAGSQEKNAKTKKVTLPTPTAHRLSPNQKKGKSNSGKVFGLL